MGLSQSTLNPANCLIFYPESNPDIDGYIHNTILPSNGHKIPLYYHIHNRSIKPSKRKCLVYSHGNSNTLESMRFTIHEFIALGIDLVFYDYQGYGYSNIEGNVYPCESACIQNLKDVVNFLRKRGYDDKNITLYGRSLGTGVVVEYLSQNDFHGKAILVCPFTRISEAAGNLAEKYLTMLDVFKSIEYIDKAQIPIFFIHAKEDHIVPFSHGPRLYKKYKESCKKNNIKIPPPLWVSKGDHNTFEYQYGFKKFMGRIDQFIKQKI